MANNYVDLPEGTGGGGAAGVGSVNGASGDLTLIGSGIDIDVFGTNITFSIADNSPGSIAGWLRPDGTFGRIPQWDIDEFSGGLNIRLSFEVDDFGQNTNMNSFGVEVRPQQPSPNDLVTLMNCYYSIDSDASGYAFGTAGDAGGMLSLSLNHQGTSDVGRLYAITMNGTFGNGTDPFQIGGFSYSSGVGTTNDGVTINGQIQGYGFQPHVASGAIAGADFFMRAFYDNSTVNIAVNGYESASLNPNIEAISNGHGFTGVNVSPSINELEGNSSFNGVTISPSIGNINTGGFTGININPTITDDVGNRFVSGISINMDSVIGTSVYALTANAGRVSLRSDVTGGEPGFRTEQNLDTSTTGTVSSTFGNNQLGGQLHIVDGFPINAGQFGIGNNLGIAVIAEDSMGVDGSGLGLGFMMNGFVTQVAVADGKTFESLTFMGAGASVPGGVGTTGVMNEVAMFRALGLVPGGGTLTVNNLYGFKVESVLSSLSPVNSWGLFVDDPLADNYMARSLAIGTTSKKVSNANVGLEIEGTKAVRFANITTVQKLAMSALPGMQVFDTTLSQMSYFNGTSWVNF